jgi:hypothetical protein
VNVHSFFTVIAFKLIEIQYNPRELIMLSRSPSLFLFLIHIFYNLSLTIATLNIRKFPLHGISTWTKFILGILVYPRAHSFSFGVFEFTSVFSKQYGRWASIIFIYDPSNCRNFVSSEENVWRY